MSEIKLIKKDTDLSGIYRTKHDLVMYEKQYDVYKVEGYNHTIRGYEPINLWACPSDEEPSYENLIQFNGNAPTWGVTFDQTNYMSDSWGETEVRGSGKCWITRNGEKFYNIGGRDMAYALSKAQYFLVRMWEESPLYFNERDWKEQAIGEKIWYDGEPAIIGGFSSENEMKIVSEDGHFITYADLLSKYVKWFRG